MHFVVQQWRRVRYAVRGLVFALKFDRSVRVALYGLGSISAIAIAITQPVTQEEFLILVMAYMLILITEIQNSALEYALDHLHPETHDNIGRSKDLAAAAVLIASTLYCIVVGTLIVSRL